MERIIPWTKIPCLLQPCLMRWLSRFPPGGNKPWLPEVFASAACNIGNGFKKKNTVPSGWKCQQTCDFCSIIIPWMATLHCKYILQCAKISSLSGSGLFILPPFYSHCADGGAWSYYFSTYFFFIDFHNVPLTFRERSSYTKTKGLYFNIFPFLLGFCLR